MGARATALLLGVIALGAIFGGASRASAQGLVRPSEADCSTPRRALLTWLVNLEGDDPRPEAVRCFDWARAGVPQRSERLALATRLKRVLDARGLYIDASGITDEEAPDGVSRLAPFPDELPEFFLVRRDGWRVSLETIRNIPAWDRSTLDVAPWVELLPDWTRDPFLGAALWQWLGLVALGLMAVAIRWFSSRLVRNQGAKLIATLARGVDTTLVHRAALPVGTLLAALALVETLPLLRFGVDLSRALLFGLRVSSALSAVLVVYRLVDVGAGVMAKRAEATETRLDDQLVPLVRKSLKVVTVVLGSIFVLQNLEVDVASLIAGVSLGGLAFTLAARDTVANFFGSINIFADQPFQVGDWVAMQGVEGMVEEVGMRSTRLRTLYRSVVTIPNSKVADGVIDNFGARDARRILVKIGLRYETTPSQMEAFCDGLRAILAASPMVRKDDYIVAFSGFADSALEVTLEYFLPVETRAEELRHSHHIFMEVLRLTRTLGVEIAFPTRTLHLATRAKETEQLPPSALPDTQLAETVLAFGPGGALSQPLGTPLTHGFRAEDAAPASGAARGAGGQVPPSRPTRA